MSQKARHHRLSQTPPTQLLMLCISLFFIFRIDWKKRWKGVYMKMQKNVQEKSWFGKLTVAIGKLVLKIGSVVVIGAIISYIIFYIKGYNFGATMRVVGIVIACVGLASQAGESNMRGDYNYNMAKMRDSKMLANEFSGRLTSDSLRFFIWMGTSGVLLFILGSYLV
jgi:hypothetical protein